MTIGHVIVHRARMDSTMDLLDELARVGAEEGTVVLADVQERGRGRAGRSWIGAKGGLYCSILLRPKVRPDQLGPLPLLIGVAVAETLEMLPSVECQLKWPNDVLVEERKIAGILLQSRLGQGGIEFLNVGIGVNVEQSASELPENATSMRIVSGRDVKRDDLLPVLWDRIGTWYSAFAALSDSPPLDAWRRRAAMVGEQVSVQFRDSELDGVFEDVDERGQAVLRLSNGTVQVINHGDIVRGPRRAGR